MFGLSKNEKAAKALKENDLTLLRQLLENGADSDSFADKDQARTLLHEAVMKNNKPAMLLLLEYGANVDRKTKNGFIAEDMTADSEIKDMMTQHRLLCAIMQHNEASVLRLLSDHPSWDLNKIKNWQGRTALHLAARNGMEDICKIILDRGADINASDRDGNTPLHLASDRTKKCVVQLLLDRGANDQLKNSSGKVAEELAFFDAVKEPFIKKALRNFEAANLPQKQETLPPPLPPVIPVRADEIILTRPLADRVLMEVFNFKTQEYTRMIRASEQGPVEHAEHLMFPEVKNRARLKEAFELYRQKGGTADETILHAIVEPRVKKPLPGINGQSGA